MLVCRMCVGVEVGFVARLVVRFVLSVDVLLGLLIVVIFIEIKLNK